MSNQYKDIDSLIEGEYEKIWSHPRSSPNKVRTNPELKGYDLEKVSIPDLVKSNDLSNKVNMSNHYEMWSPTGQEEDLNPDAFVYDREKDMNPNDFIRATREIDGTIKLANGRHRIKALSNGGYTHAMIPVHDKFFDTNPLYAAAYEDAKNGNLNLALRQIRALNKSGQITNENAIKLKEKLKNIYKNWR